MESKIVKELPPSQGNPRNSEGDFLRLKDGRIIFAYSAYVGDSFQDHAETEIRAIFSADEGETWSEPKTLFATSDFGACQNIMAVSFLRMKDGAVGIFFLVRYSNKDMRYYLFRSYDECETFGEPVCCMPKRKGYFVTENQRVIRTSSGRLIVPGNLHNISDSVVGSIDSDVGTFALNAYGTCYFFYSDDDGFTWEELPGKLASPFPNSLTGLHESGIIEIKPNVLLTYSRTDMCMQYGSYSFNDGLNWTPVEPLRFFTSPDSPMIIQKLADGRLFAVWNPVPRYTFSECSLTHSRAVMAYAFSENGINWYGQTIFENDKDENDKGRGYCYPSIFSTEKFILVSYCAGGSEDGCELSRLRLRKFYID